MLLICTSSSCYCCFCCCCCCPCRCYSLSSCSSSVLSVLDLQPTQHPETPPVANNTQRPLCSEVSLPSLWPKRWRVKAFDTKTWYHGSLKSLRGSFRISDLSRLYLCSSWNDGVTDFRWKSGQMDQKTEPFLQLPFVKPKRHPRPNTSRHQPL